MATIQNDADIVALYFQRDEQAILETEAAYGRYCMSIAMGILHHAPDAEECVNDTYLRTWQTIPPNRPSSLKLYVGRIVRNLSISRYRTQHRKKRDASMEISLSELEECIPLREEQSAELRELLNEFLAELKPDDRRLFVGRYWYAYAPRTLAKAYGLTTNAVNLRIMRVRARLKQFLEERGYHI